MMDNPLSLEYEDQAERALVDAIAALRDARRLVPLAYADSRGISEALMLSEQALESLGEEC